MACAKQIGLTSLPIVCINVDGYYENFRQMLERAHEDELTYLKPHEILHFEPTAEAAVRWIEEQAAIQEKEPPKVQPKLRKKKKQVVGRSASFMSTPIGDWTSSSGSSRWENGKLVFDGSASWGRWALTFAAGMVAGVIVVSQSSRFSRS